MTQRDCSVLIVGHSHTQALASALADTADPERICIVNLRNLSGLLPSWKRLPAEAVSIVRSLWSRIARRSAWQGQSVEQSALRLQMELYGFRPDVICLSVHGNAHNILGVIEHPEPFSVGDPGTGQVPVSTEAEGRHFIPSSVMKSVLRAQMHPDLTARLFARFPKARRILLEAPPPIRDTEFIRAHPGVFRNKLHLGHPPNDLRMRLYRLQQEVNREIAGDHDAFYLMPDDSLVDAQGFMQPAFHNTDPTHGNRAYGAVMLCRVLDEAARLVSVESTP